MELHTYHLISKEQDGLERELAVAKVEEVLERGSKKVDDHGIVVALLAVPSDERDTDTTGEGLVDFGLVLELRVLGFDRLKLDGDLLTRDDVDAEVDVTEGAGADLLTDAVLSSYTKIHDCCGVVWCGSGSSGVVVSVRLSLVSETIVYERDEAVLRKVLMLNSVFG